MPKLPNYSKTNRKQQQQQNQLQNEYIIYWNDTKNIYNAKSKKKNKTKNKYLANSLWKRDQVKYESIYITTTTQKNKPN